MSNKIILPKRRGNKDFVGKTKTRGICWQHKPHKRSTDGKHAIKHAQQHLSSGSHKLAATRRVYNPIRVTQITTIDSINCKDMGQPELSFTAGGRANHKQVQPILKLHWKFLLNVSLQCHLTTSTPRYSLCWFVNLFAHKNLHVNVSRGFIHRPLLADQWINKL